MAHSIHGIVPILHTAYRMYSERENERLNSINSNDNKIQFYTRHTSHSDHSEFRMLTENCVRMENEIKVTPWKWES